MTFLVMPRCWGLQSLVQIQPQQLNQKRYLKNKHQRLYQVNSLCPYSVANLADSAQVRSFLLQLIYRSQPKKSWLLRLIGSWHKAQEAPPKARKKRQLILSVRLIVGAGTDE